MNPQSNHLEVVAPRIIDDIESLINDLEVKLDIITIGSPAPGGAQTGLSPTIQSESFLVTRLIALRARIASLKESISL
jgi:hypothetical protein